MRFGAKGFNALKLRELSLLAISLESSPSVSQTLSCLFYRVGKVTR
jgi:hypothetical protein